MNQKILGGAVVAVVVIGLAVLVASRGDNNKSTSNTTSKSSSSSSMNMPKSSSDEAVETNTVTIKDFAFSPATIKVKKGTTVTWTNQDSAAHTVDGSGLESGSLAQGVSYKFTFNQAGTYSYKCDFHPNMTGKVIVE